MRQEALEDEVEARLMNGEGKLSFVGKLTGGFGKEEGSGRDAGR